MFEKIKSELRRLFPKSNITDEMTEAEVHNALSEVSLEEYNTLQEQNDSQATEISELKESLKDYAKSDSVMSSEDIQGMIDTSLKDYAEAISKLEKTQAGIIAGTVASELPSKQTDSEITKTLKEISDAKTPEERTQEMIKKNAEKRRKLRENK